MIASRYEANLQYKSALAASPRRLDRTMLMAGPSRSMQSCGLRLPKPCSYDPKFAEVVKRGDSAGFNKLLNGRLHQHETHAGVPFVAGR